MKNINNQLNKRILLINKDTLTEHHNPIIKKGNNIYILRRLYIITKYNLYNHSKKKNISFYLKTKMNIKRDISYVKPLDDDIFVENYRGLIKLVANFGELKDITHCKIILFNTDLRTIEGNEQLMNYKGKIIYAKIIENIKYIEDEKTYTIKTIKNTFNKRLSAIKDRDEDGNISNKFLSSSMRSTFLVSKNFKNSKDNNHVFNRNLGNSLSENTSSSIEKNKINPIKRQTFIKKKLNTISLKCSKNSPEIEKEENDSNDNNNSYKLSTNQLDEVIKPKNQKINQEINTNINDSSIYDKLSKTKSEFDWFKNRNQRINKKFFNTEKLFNSINTAKNYEAPSINKSFNWRQNYLANNFYKTFIKKHNFPSLYSKKNNKSFLNISQKIISYPSIQLENYQKLKQKKITYNYSQILFDKKSQEFADLKTIYKYLKYPKLQEQENNTKRKEKYLKTSLKNLKEIYDACLYEINIIINNINNYFPDVTHFIQQFDYSFITKYKNIDFYICLKQYLLYCFIENFILNKKDMSLNQFINIVSNSNSRTEKSYKSIAHILEYLLEKIIETRENKNFNLTIFVKSKRKVKDFILSKNFFFIFILCSNYFDQTQREIGERMLLTLEIKEKLKYKNYFNYFLYFKANYTLNLDNKINFITKFLYIVDSGCLLEKDPELIKKFGNNVQFIFRIDDRTKQFILKNEEKNKMNIGMIRRINNAFYSMINFFGNNNFNTTQILSLN